MAKKGLSTKQTKALALLVAGQTKDQVSTVSGVSIQTLDKWFKDPVFRDELRLALERMRQTFEARVMGLANNAAVVVQDMIADPNDKNRQLEGAKLAFNAAVRMANRYKELQVEGYVAPAQPLVVFPTGTKFSWQQPLVVPPTPTLELPDAIDVEAEVVEEE